MVRYTTMMTFNNQYVLYQIENNKQAKQLKIIQELKQLAPSLSDIDLLFVYQKSISIHQSKNQENGAFLENIISRLLDEHAVSYQKQVVINRSGIIIGFGKKHKCYHIIDFVVGNPIEIGTSITNYKVVSCKTTCRERWTQDSWTFTFPPTLYILLTTSNDYPSSQRFRESTKRKIITCLPKRKDNRLFTLNIENMIDELQ